MKGKEMTNGEKIEPTTKNCESCKYYGSHHEVCNYCYKCSLWTEKEPTTKNDLGVDTVSRKDVHDMLENLPITVEDKWFNWLQKACIRLAELPSVTSQPCEDAISRQAVLDEMDKRYVVGDFITKGFIKKLPSVTSQLSSELDKNSKKLEKDFGESDCISRVDAIRVASGYCHPSNVAKELAKLPSVTPIRPKGHWIDTREISTNRRGQIVHEVICSECSGIAYFRSMGDKYIGANLCPNCSADMRGNESNK